jgi:hypothetical protein
MLPLYTKIVTSTLHGCSLLSKDNTATCVRNVLFQRNITFQNLLHTFLMCVSAVVSNATVKVKTLDACCSFQLVLGALILSVSSSSSSGKAQCVPKWAILLHGVFYCLRSLSRAASKLNEDRNERMAVVVNSQHHSILNIWHSLAHLFGIACQLAGAYRKACLARVFFSFQSLQSI